MPTKPKRTTSPTSQYPRDPLETELLRLGRELDAIEVRLDKADKTARTPGRFKGKLVVGSSFFEPITEDELTDFQA